MNVNRTTADTNTVEPAIALCDQLPADRITVITKIAADLDMEPVEVLG